MFKVGDKAKIISGIYEGREVEIAEVKMGGYSVYGLGGAPTTKVSLFFEEDLESLVMQEITELNEELY
jgi:hypothetical protein